MNLNWAAVRPYSLLPDSKQTHFESQIVKPDVTEGHTVWYLSALLPHRICVDNHHEPWLCPPWHHNIDHNCAAPALGLYGNRITWRCHQNFLKSNASSCNLTSQFLIIWLADCGKTWRQNHLPLGLQSVLVSIRCPRECWLSTEGGRSHYGRALRALRARISHGDLVSARSTRPITWYPSDIIIDYY